MKKLFIAALALFSLSASAQKTPKKTGTATTAKPFKNATDSLSYALGVSVASFYKQQGIKNLNSAVLAKAVSEVFAGKKLVMDENQCQSIIIGHMQEKEAEKSKGQAEKAKPIIEEGQKFLAQNKTRPGVKTIASGLQYEVITEGTGAKPSATDMVVVNYKGTLINGEEFDNSYKRGEPLSIALNQVIPGWTEGLQLMPVGSKYKLYIPYQLGYGMRGAGSIPPGAALIFEVELLDIKK